MNTARKKFASIGLIAISLLSAACGNTAESQANTQNTVIQKEASVSPSPATPIKLTINGKEMKAWLNDSVPAKELREQMPKTVRLNDSDNDFCGDTLDIGYRESDVQSGYRNGDLAYYPPARNFVIFVHGEETSASTGNLVIIGHIDEPQAVLDSLHGDLTVTIESAE